jgi:transcriptional regulator with XRE-family HTH domain
MEEGLDENKRQKIRSRFGLLVKEKRLALGWSQEELAFQSGLHRTYIGHVERAERNLSLENIFVLAYALRCHPRDLIPDPP